MTQGKPMGDEGVVAARTAMQHHGTAPDELIPILNEIEHQAGYLPAPAMEEVSKALRIPESRLYSVATFYRMLSVTPRGRHVIQFCESAPCHVEGGRQVWQALLGELGIKSGETSQDGRWTLLTTSCLGICGVGPVLVVDEDVFGNVKPEQVAGILARYA